MVQWKCLYFIDLNGLIERTQNINHVSIKEKKRWRACPDIYQCYEKSQR